MLSFTMNTMQLFQQVLNSLILQASALLTGSLILQANNLLTIQLILQFNLSYSTTYLTV
jgi:hypothetical protein